MSSASEPELKPCPFCGSAEAMLEYVDDQFKDHNVFVACGSCKASSAIHFSKREAVAAWNRRAERGASSTCPHVGVAGRKPLLGSLARKVACAINRAGDGRAAVRDPESPAPQKNYDRYRTAEEAWRAFNDMCDRNTCDTCQLAQFAKAGNGCVSCRVNWLYAEAERGGAK